MPLKLLCQEVLGVTLTHRTDTLKLLCQEVLGVTLTKQSRLPTQNQPNFVRLRMQATGGLRNLSGVLQHYHFTRRFVWKFLTTLPTPQVLFRLAI